MLMNNTDGKKKKSLHCTVKWARGSEMGKEEANIWKYTETRLEITRTRWNKSSKGDLEWVKSLLQPCLPHFVDIFQKCARQTWIEQLRSLSLLGHVCLQLNWDKNITCTSKHLPNSEPHSRGVRKPQCEGCGEKFPAGKDLKAFWYHLWCRCEDTVFPQIGLSDLPQGVENRKKKAFDFEPSQPHYSTHFQ